MATVKAKKETGIKLLIYAIAEKLALPDYSAIEETNADNISEQGYYASKAEREEIAQWEEGLSEEEIEERAEKARYKAEEEAQKDLFRQCIGAVLRAAEEIWGFHHLDIREGRLRVGEPRLARLVVTPKSGKSWYDVAAEIARTINGVGLTHVPAEDYRRNPRKWGGEHLKSMQVQPEVYGGPSAERIYESSFR